MKFIDVYERLPSLYVRLVHSKKKLRRALRHLGMNDEATDADATTFYKEGDATFIVYMNNYACLISSGRRGGLRKILADG